MPDSAVDRSAEGPVTVLRDPLAAPWDAPAGDVLMLVGNHGQRGSRHASVHRSPPPAAMTLGKRVVLVLDEEDEPNFGDGGKTPPWLTRAAQMAIRKITE